MSFKETTVDLSWNVRGAYNKDAKRHIRDMIRRLHPSIFIIMETHIQYAWVQSFWESQGYKPIAIIEAIGHSGGLWIFQRNGLAMTTTVQDISPHTISFRITSGGEAWVCTGLYASPIPANRPPTWQHLCQLSNSISEPWLVVGDFNDIIMSSEQNGGSFVQHRANALLSMMDSCDLLHLPTAGGHFTWHKNCRGHRQVAKKLDRGMANSSWRTAFSQAFVEVQCRLHSDHNTILVRCGGLPEEWGPRPFRFEAAWVTHEDYHQVVHRAWTRRQGSPVEALEQVRADSLVFNKEVFGNIFRRKREIERRLKGVQHSLERVDSVRLVMLEHQLQRDYDQILFQEELLWYQKSLEMWIKLGDRNTKFFHAQTQVRRQRSKVCGLTLPGGVWCNDDNILQEEAFKFFETLFCGPTATTMDRFEVSNIPRLSDDMIHTLTQPILKEEVIATLNSMQPYKSPGPDGFQGIFFKQYWHIVGDDISHLVVQAFATGTFDPTLSETLIALIPKVDHPGSFKEFRPISLCNTVYKLITKVLVNRMRPMLDSIVSPFQSSFIPKRGTRDNAIILQDIIHAMNKSKKRGCGL